MTLTLLAGFANMGLGASNTTQSGRAAPVSLAAFSCSKSFMGQMGYLARIPAWLCTCLNICPTFTPFKSVVVAFKNSQRSIKMPTSISNVAFHGANLPLVSINNKPHFAVKPICDGIGLTWQGQLERIKRNPVLSPTISVTLTVGEDGKQREMICLPLGYLNGWLLGVNANRVKPEIRQKLIQYQMECYDVLYQHFMPKVAQQYPNTINTEQQYEIRQAVNNYAYHTGQHHQTIYNRLHIKFKIPKYQDLPAARFKEAMLFLDANHPQKNILQVDIDLSALPRDNNEVIKALVEFNAFSGRKEVTLLNRYTQVVDPCNKDQVTNLLQTIGGELYPAALDVVIGYFKGIERLYHGKVCRSFGNN